MMTDTPVVVLFCLGSALLKCCFSLPVTSACILFSWDASSYREGKKNTVDSGSLTPTVLQHLPHHQPKEQAALSHKDRSSAFSKVIVASQSTVEEHWTSMCETLDSILRGAEAHKFCIVTLQCHASCLQKGIVPSIPPLNREKHRSPLFMFLKLSPKATI